MLQGLASMDHLLDIANCEWYPDGNGYPPDLLRISSAAAIYTTIWAYEAGRCRRPLPLLDRAG